VTKASSLTSVDVLEETRRIARDVLAPSADETDRLRNFRDTQLTLSASLSCWG
jgi:hypothetical protein